MVISGSSTLQNRPPCVIAVRHLTISRHIHRDQYHASNSQPGPNEQCLAGLKVGKVVAIDQSVLWRPS